MQCRKFFLKKDEKGEGHNPVLLYKIIHIPRGDKKDEKEREGLYIYYIMSECFIFHGKPGAILYSFPALENVTSS